MTKIPSFTEYGTVDKDTSREDLFMIVKNSGTYATPAYASGTSRKANQLKTKQVLNTPLTASRTLTASEVKNMGTTPIEIVPAPGAGYIIDPISCWYDFVWNSVAWNTGAGNLYLKTADQSVAHFKSDEAAVHLTADSIKKMHHVDGNLGELEENKGLVVYTEADSVATGNSVLIVHVTYQIFSRNP